MIQVTKNYMKINNNFLPPTDFFNITGENDKARFVRQSKYIISQKLKKKEIEK